MARWLLIPFSVALGLAGSAVLVTALVGPGPPATQASASPLGRSAGAPASVLTTVRHPTTTVTRTTRTTAPATTRAATTLPATTRAVTTLPATTPPTATPPTAPPATYQYPVRSAPSPPAPTTTTTSTTIAAIGGHLPVPLSTLPLRTKAQSGHVSPVFAALSGAGFFVAMVIMATRFLMTRPGRKR